MRWRKSSLRDDDSNCVELAPGAIRDSKNPPARCPWYATCRNSSARSSEADSTPADPRPAPGGHSRLGVRLCERMNARPHRPRYRATACSTSASSSRSR
ncbi:MAG: DUF397 domain-containing protein [Actinomycetota bacterium]|nr:DUF397 domain-containing protein [Actinomycetota bacterium]